MRSRRVGIAAVAILLVVAGLALAFSDDGSPPHREKSRSGAPRAAARFTELPAKEIVRQGVAAMAGLRNFRAQVTVQLAHRVLQIDVRRANGGACFGTVKQGRMSAEVIATEKYTFLRTSARFWRVLGSEDVIESMTPDPSKWGRFPDTEAHDFCDIPALMDELDIDDEAMAALKAKAPSPFQGYTAVTLATPDERINIVVNIHSPHYILKIDDDGGLVRLSEFDEPATVRVPRRGEFVPFVHDGIDV